MEPPPILPSLEDLLKAYITNPSVLDDSNYDTQQHWPRKANPLRLLSFDTAEHSTCLKMKRDLTTGRMMEIEQAPVSGGELVSESIPLASVASILKEAKNIDIGLSGGRCLFRI